MSSQVSESMACLPPDLVCIDTVQQQGEAALKRLLEIAQRDSHQPKVIARFLMGLYNGDRFPFDLTDFRRLDASIFQDCMLVLLMDYRPRREVHRYFDKGGDVWERLAAAWRFKSHEDGSWR